MTENNTQSGSNLGGECSLVESGSGHMNWKMNKMDLALNTQQNTVLMSDLNSEEMTVIRLPLTDSQQVQLRAQILVSRLLQKDSLPDEVLMVAAFTDINGGRQGSNGARVLTHEWEKPWRVAVERLKSSSSALVTNVAGAKKSVSLQIRVLNKSGSKSLSFEAGSQKSQESGMNMMESFPTSTTSAIAVATPVSPSPSLKLVDGLGKTSQPKGASIKEMAVFSGRMPGQLDQASFNAEEAMISAVSAIRESESIRNQLRAEKKSGLISGKEASLAFSSVTITAAALVSKAAAAAARVAYEAALESLPVEKQTMPPVEDRSLNLTHSSLLSTSSMPTSCKTILESAREAVKKRLEIASEANKRARSLEAIVRAAELAAATVSHVGAVVEVDNLPSFRTESSDVFKAPSSDAVKGMLIETGTGDKFLNSVAEPESHLKPKELSISGKACLQEAVQKTDVQQNLKKIERTQNPVDCNGMSDAEVGPGVAEKSFTDCSSQMPEDSIVEIFSDEEGLRGVWFSGRVIKVDSGKTLVRYDEILAEDGGGQLEEWVEVIVDSSKAPRLRLAHPIVSRKSQGRRKRRRQSMGSPEWSIGDHVDAWMRDGWWEGIVTAESVGDENKYKILFPGEGDTAIIRSWNLRPSLIWHNDKWILWTDIKVQNTESEKAHEDKDEVPPAKRIKRDKRVDATMESLSSENVRSVVPEKIVVSTSNGSQSVGDLSRMKQEGETTRVLEEEEEEHPGGREIKGSRVVLGVPKPTGRHMYLNGNSGHQTLKRVGGNSTRSRTPSREGEIAVSTSQSKSELSKKSKFAELKSGNKSHFKQLQRPEFKLASKYETLDSKKQKLPSDFHTNKKPSQNVQDNNRGDRPHARGHRLGSEGKKKIAHTPKQKVSKNQAISAESGASLAKSKGVFKGKPLLKVSVANESKRNSGNISADLMEPRRTSRVSQPTSKLLEGLETTQVGKSGVVKSSISFTSAVKALLSP